MTSSRLITGLAAVTLVVAAARLAATFSGGPADAGSSARPTPVEHTDAAVGPFEAALGPLDQPDPELRGQLAAAWEKDRSAALRTLEARLQSKSPDERRQAAGLVALLGRDGQPLFRSLLKAQDDPDHYVARAATEALKVIVTDRAAGRAETIVEVRRVPVLPQ